MCNLAEILIEDAKKCGCLQTEETPSSTFPLDCLPKDLKNYVQELLRAEQVPVDFSAPLMLLTTSAVCFRKIFVQILPNKITPLNLYGLFVAPSGFGKTSIFKRVLQPLYDKNNALHQALNISGMSAVIPAKIFVEDITSERLAKVLAENNERICYLASEGRKFIDVVVGCYKDKASDETLLLKCFSGDSCDIERNNGQQIYLQNPLITTIIAVQPDKAMQLFKHKTLRDSGLLPRFLCIASQVEPQLLPADPIVLNSAIESKVHNRWKLLLDEDLARKRPVIIHANNEVYTLYRDYYNTIQKRLGAQGDISSLGAPFAGRWAEMAIRMAGILHIYENPVEKLLSADTFQKALKIQESFFVQQQMNFIDFIYNKEQDNALNKIYELLHKNNQKLSIRDTYRQLHIDKASLLQLVEQNPSLRLDDKYICCDNCDSN